MVCQVLHVVGEIVGMGNLVKELSLLVSFRLLDLGSSGLLCVKHLASI